MSTHKSKGIQAGLASAIFLGLSPVFGKQAILFGFSPLLVVTLRTCIATGMLIVVIGLSRRTNFQISPKGLYGCLLAGTISGFGSVLYYASLGYIDASLGQTLYATYPLFVALWLVFDRQPLGRLTILRISLSLPAVYLLVGTGFTTVNPLGIGLMLGAAVLFALHLLINQEMLATFPASTVTLYTLLAMSTATLITYFLIDRQIPPSTSPWWPIAGMSAMMFFSRFTLFLGVKHIGGLQAAILGLGEMVVTVIVAFWWLGDRLTLFQWVGVALLATSLVLVGFEQPSSTPARNTRLLKWLRL
ncbi:MAG: DMT family transporter [Chloroflexi bacterium]|nr:DMT family transporter [Chloroflexota bacterium]